MSVATKINCLWLENLSMLHIASSLNLHDNRLHVLHDLLQHCFPLHVHVRGHQDQLLGGGELEKNIMVWEKFRIIYIYIASALPLSAVRFDVLHTLLQHRNALHGHVHGHHGQLLGLGQLGIVENLLMYIIDVSEGLLMHFQTLKYLNITKFPFQKLEAYDPESNKNPNNKNKNNNNNNKAIPRADFLSAKNLMRTLLTRRTAPC